MWPSWPSVWVCRWPPCTTDAATGRGRSATASAGTSSSPWATCAHGSTLDPVTGEVAELQPLNQVLSKRAVQVERNLDRLRADWGETHPGEEPRPALVSRMTAQAWALDRPQRKPTLLGCEAAWRAELDAAGYHPNLERQSRPAQSLDSLEMHRIASRAVDRPALASQTKRPRRSGAFRGMWRTVQACRTPLHYGNHEERSSHARRDARRCPL